MSETQRDISQRPKIVAGNGESFSVSRELFDAIKDFSQEPQVNGKIEIFFKDGGISRVTSTREKHYRSSKS